MKRGVIAGTGLALLLLGGCGGREESSGQPSADEKQKLDNIAGKLDNEETFDTSPDSLVPADDNGAPGNAAQPAGTSNQTAPAGTNQAAPAGANQAGPPASANQAQRN
jgi:hypothetical protein